MHKLNMMGTEVILCMSMFNTRIVLAPFCVRLDDTFQTSVIFLSTIYELFVVIKILIKIIQSFELLSVTLIELLY